jgi:hypothetical protein
MGNANTPLHRQPPLGGSIKIHARFGVVAGRSSDLQAWPSDRMALLLTLFPVPGRTSDFWGFVPAHRCGAVPVSHRIPFNVSLRNVTSKRTTRYGAALGLSTQMLRFFNLRPKSEGRIRQLRNFGWSRCLTTTKSIVQHFLAQRKCFRV